MTNFGCVSLNGRQVIVMLDPFGTTSHPRRAGMPHETRRPLSPLQACESLTGWRHNVCPGNVVFLSHQCLYPDHHHHHHRHSLAVSTDASNVFRWHPQLHSSKATVGCDSLCYKKIDYIFLLHGHDIDLQSNVLTRSINSNHYGPLILSRSYSFHHATIHS